MALWYPHSQKSQRFKLRDLGGQVQGKALPEEPDNNNEVVTGTVYVTDPAALCFSKRNGPTMKVVVKPHQIITCEEYNGFVGTDANLYHPKFQQLCVLTAPSR
ncbi:hypothetical protein TNCV_2171021 [Trichonephila clavipes]|nr:hypothetical protein TNCV_2171021 [Trichonephila clavipes]